MNIINLLSNDVVVYPNTEGNPIVFPSQGKLQVRMMVEDVTQNGIIKRGHWTHTRGLPDPAPDTLCIVSSLVAMFELYENDRQDLIFPWALIRGESGNVLACRSLTRPHRNPRNSS